MGRELGPMYNALDHEVAWLHAKWNQYRQLYGRSPERVAFLNKVAGHFFGVVQRTLMEDILLHLARLTDRPKSNRLTLQRLPKCVSDHAFGTELAGLVRTACKACDDVAWISRAQLGQRPLTRSRAVPTLKLLYVPSGRCCIISRCAFGKPRRLTSVSGPREATPTLSCTTF
jgi:hypothetical protein